MGLVSAQKDYDDHHKYLDFLDNLDDQNDDNKRKQIKVRNIQYDAMGYMNKVIDMKNNPEHFRQFMEDTGLNKGL